MTLRPLLRKPAQAHTDIAWGAMNSDGKIVGHRNWQEVVVLSSDGYPIFTTPEPASATHFVWADSGSEFAYVCDDDHQVAVFKQEKYGKYADQSPDAKTCAPESLRYIDRGLMFETKAKNRRGKDDTFTQVGNHDAELHVTGACADRFCVYGIDTEDQRLIGYPHVSNSQCYLFETHSDDLRPDHNRCATNGQLVAVAGDTMLRMYKISDRDILWQVPATVIGVPFFLGPQSVATLENNGHGLVLRDTTTGTQQVRWGIGFTLRAHASSNGKSVVLNMGDGSTVVYDASDLFG